MITLMFLTMLFGTVTYSIPGLIVVAGMFYIFWIMYLLEAICTCILQKKLKLSGGFLNFIPVVRGVNEARIFSTLTGKPEKKTIWAIVTVVAKFIYAYVIVSVYYCIFSNYKGVAGYYLREFINAIPRALKTDYMQNFGIPMVICFIVAFLVLTILRTKAMKATGYFGIVALIVALFFAPIWTLIQTIYFASIGKNRMPIVQMVETVN